MGNVMRSQAAPVVALLAVGMLVIPLPPIALDLFFLVSLSLALVVAAIALATREPLEFSAFPSLLLLTTLLRVALDVSAARLILLQANAGTLVSAFGGFVVGRNIVVGVLVFILLFIVQFMVITRGTERVAEVSARFTLDAMAGKQMAIDADLHAGAITDKEARDRRQRISQEADFYGAMDGAARFVRGDAVATVAVLTVNVIAGLVVGVVSNHLPIGTAVTDYTTLAVGDALLSQLPAFMLSTAAGVLVTRAGDSQDGRNFSDVLFGQLTLRPEPFYLLAGFLLIIGVLMPVTPITFILAAAAGYVGYVISVRNRPKPAPPEEVAKPAVPRRPADALPDPISLTIGYGLLPIADAARGGDLVERLNAVAERLTRDLGLTVPRPRIRDDLALNPTAYRVWIRSLQVGEGVVFPDREMVVADPLPETPGGLRGTDPIYGLASLWVTAEQARHLTAEGYTATPASAVLAAHVKHVLTMHAYQLLDRQGTQALLDRVKKADKAAVEELVPSMLSLSAVQAVLRNLLREGVPIIDGVTVVEALGDAAALGVRDPIVLTERVRHALAPVIRSRIAGGDAIELVTLSPRLRDSARQAVRADPPGLNLEPAVIERLVSALRRAQIGSKVVALLTPSSLRPFFARALEAHLPGFPVLAETEIDPQGRYQVRQVDVE